MADDDLPDDASWSGSAGGGNGSIFVQLCVVAELLRIQITEAREARDDIVRDVAEPWGPLT